jgi:hypothetical protein
MFSIFSGYAARLWLAGLLTFTLIGAQVVQESPLHNHAQETVDCALCHLQHPGDGTDVARVLAHVERVVQAAHNAASPTVIPFVNPSPYQGRAPPALS